ncbi:MAG: DUF4912 domain-containing protein [Alkalispirochaetaceae bacterium]
MIRQHLAELSLEGLMRVASRHDIDVEADVDRDELIEVLVDAIEEAQEERERLNNHPVKVQRVKYELTRDDEVPPDAGAFGEVELPERYNDTRIALMLRDPAWAYAYWDIRESKRREYQVAPRFDGIFLRVLEVEDSSEREFRVRDTFEIPVKLDDSSWYIHLPSQATIYRIQLIAKNAHRRELLAVSNSVTVPKGGFADAHPACDEDCKKILAFSGLKHLDVAYFDRKIPQRIIGASER